MRRLDRRPMRNAFSGLDRGLGCARWRRDDSLCQALGRSEALGQSGGRLLHMLVDCLMVKGSKEMVTYRSKAWRHVAAGECLNLGSDGDSVYAADTDLGRERLGGNRRRDRRLDGPFLGGLGRRLSSSTANRRRRNDGHSVRRRDLCNSQGVAVSARRSRRRVDKGDRGD
jgi:hypothetical protein